MGLNPFFKQGTRGEQSLIQQLVNEQLRMYGVEVHYIPRKYITTNTVIREVIESQFTDAYPIEAYVENYDGYEGQGTLLSKFGIENSDDLTLTVSKERFEEYISPLLKNETNARLTTRPKEGDLIYFPLGDRLFEIKFVEHETPFYQLQKTYVYTLKCELFRPQDEVLDTNIEEIDNNLVETGYIQTLSLFGIGSTATATATFTNGGLRNITILDSGYGYTSTPVVSISTSPGTTASAVAITTYRSGLGTSRSIDRIELTNPGAGYTVPPSVVFQGGGGTGVAVTVGIATTGGVGIITVSSGGAAYSADNPPTITFSAPLSGSTAIGTAIVSAAGTISGIRLSSAGVGYTVSPIITISAPPLVGSGNYIFNEIVTGGTSGTTGRVKTWNASTKELSVSIVNGSFIVGESVTGGESGAVYSMRDQNSDDLTLAFADNDNIETEADNILDFTERNPFGEV